MLLKNKTYFITGSSRGIGLAIALKLAKEGANIVITGKTTEPHPTLENTIYTAAEAVEQAGGKALAIQLDVRDENAIQQAMEQAAQHFGGIDALVNNASAIFLAPIEKTSMKRFDLMNQVNARASFACAQVALPYLKAAEFGHILTMSPPLTMQSKWFKDYLAYSMAKMGMSMTTLGLAAHLQQDGIAVNSLWPKTVINTAAIRNNFPPQFVAASRTPDIVADAAFAILTNTDPSYTGQFLIDEEVLAAAGVTDFEQYATNPGTPLMTDFYLDG